ncbi:MAG TPA: NAD(P)-binding domain-containing protein, partial [Gemmatimonadaceae bacterium]|nr:NAD(P)-binding domain-containing protein [Gemmatimonadaceae bacterium]
MRLGAAVQSIEPGTITIRTAAGEPERIPADRVYVLTGFTPDFELFRSMGIELDPVTERPVLNPETLETNVRGIHMAGSIVSGRAISEVFIENGRYDGEKIFGDPVTRRRAAEAYEETPRPVGE